MGVGLVACLGVNLSVVANSVFLLRGNIAAPILAAKSLIGFHFASPNLQLDMFVTSAARMKSLTLQPKRQKTIDSSWGELGFGVSYLNTGSSVGNDIFIGYAGWTVRQSWTQKWVTELYRARLAELGIRHLYSVKGPRDPEYNAREIANSALGNHLLEIAESAQRFIIVAHSSGSYVAHELLQQLYESGKDQGQTAGKIIYYNLDGGATGLRQNIVNQLAAMYCVYVDGRLGRSANALEMEQLAQLYAPKAKVVRIEGNLSGCNSGARWCLHDVLINQKPYNPSTFNLFRDYSLLNENHPVTVDYLDNLEPPINEGEFKDTRHYFAEGMLAELRNLGILEGYKDNTFLPDESINRAEFAAIVAKAFREQPVTRETQQFIDVQREDWFANAVKFVTTRGMMSGFPDKTFRPEAPLSRLEALVSLASMLESKHQINHLQIYYDDANAIPDWALKAIAKATDGEIVVNYPNLRQLRPRAHVTRGEVAAFVYRTLVWQRRAEDKELAYVVVP